MTTPITQILNPNVPIMNKDGTPTSLFQRMWANIKAVNKSGDTMTGSLTINPGSLTVTNTGTAGSLILNNTGATNGLVTFNQKNSGYNCDMTFTNTNVPSVSNVISCRNTGDFWIFLNTATNLDLCTNASLRFRIDGAGNLKGGASALTLIDSNRIFYLPQYTTAGLPAAGTAGRLLYDTTVGAVKYDTGSAWTTLGSGSGGGGGLFAGQLSATPTQASTGLSNMLSGTGTTSSNLANGQRLVTTGNLPAIAYTTTVPTAPYSFTALLIGNSPSSTLSMGWTDGTKLQFIYIAPSNGQPTVISDNNYSSFNSQQAATGTGFPSHIAWFKVRDDGTNVYFMVSADGLTFYTIYQVAKASGFLGASGYSHVMVGNQNSSPCDCVIASWTQGT